jgi:hypothetical protein
MSGMGIRASAVSVGDFDRMTAHPEVETDGRGGATMIWRAKRKRALRGRNHAEG